MNNLRGRIVAYDSKNNTIVIQLMFIPKILELDKDVEISACRQSNDIIIG